MLQESPLAAIWRLHSRPFGASRPRRGILIVTVAAVHQRGAMKGEKQPLRPANYGKRE